MGQRNGWRHLCDQGENPKGMEHDADQPKIAQAGPEHAKKRMRDLHLMVQRQRVQLQHPHNGDDELDIGGCCGFFGDFEESGLLGDARSEIDAFIRNQRRELFDRIKAMIRNRVPLSPRGDMLNGFQGAFS